MARYKAVCGSFTRGLTNMARSSFLQRRGIRTPCPCQKEGKWSRGAVRGRRLASPEGSRAVPGRECLPPATAPWRAPGEPRRTAEYRTVQQNGRCSASRRASGLTRAGASELVGTCSCPHLPASSEGNRSALFPQVSSVCKGYAASH